MSTRTNILIASADGAIYQYYIHYDGYPEGVGCRLVRWLANAYSARNDYELARRAAEFRRETVPEKKALLRFLLAEFRQHYRDNEGAGAEDMLEPEDVYDAFSPAFLHSDIEYLYLLDMLVCDESVRLVCRNVRDYEWVRTYIEAEQSCRAIVRDVQVNGTLMASFSYRGS